ncbi:MAG: ABC transporter permease subunit [Thermoplasmata archaeon]
MKRILRLTAWVLREPTVWRIALLMVLVLVFSATGGIVRSSAGPQEAPERGVENVLEDAPSVIIGAAYPFLFPLIAILATLGLAAPRESGAFATLQALGFRRGEIYPAHTLAIWVIALVPAVAAFLVLPPLVEPSLALAGRLDALYPAGYWLAMPRLFLTLLFLTLFAAAFAMLLRRPSTAFAAMIGFFFVGWYLAASLGPFFVFAPSPAFRNAYGDLRPVPGIPVDPNYTFVLYLLAALAVYLVAWIHATRRGELA